MRDELNRVLELLCKTMPESYALVYGNEAHSDIQGTVLFYPLWGGTLAVTEISGLPSSEEKCKGRFFGFHIHEGRNCKGTKEDPFADTGNHYNPCQCEHPYHAGDMPPLLGNDGYAMTLFYTNRFVPEEVIGHTVVIHDAPDDFRTQPSGASQTKIACGEIKSNA